MSVSSKLFKSFTRYSDNKIWQDEQTNGTTKKQCFCGQSVGNGIIKWNEHFVIVPYITSERSQNDVRFSIPLYTKIGYLGDGLPSQQPFEDNDYYQYNSAQGMFTKWYQIIQTKNQSLKISYDNLRSYPPDSQSSISNVVYWRGIILITQIVTTKYAICQAFTHCIQYISHYMLTRFHLLRDIFVLSCSVECYWNVKTSA